jgi:hypothetical protein
MPRKPDPTLPKRKRGRPPMELAKLPEELRRFVKRKTYGIISEDEAIEKAIGQHRIELKAFATNPPGGLGRLTHLRNYAQMVWPALRENWHPWMDRGIASVFREENVFKLGDTTIRSTAWTGCGAGGKTYMSGLIALMWYLVDPENSIAVLTSTSKGMLRKRVWAVVQDLIGSMVDPEIPGRRLQYPAFIMESRTAIQASKSDDKHAIFAMAVAEGETNKAVTRMKGLHADRMLLIIDECNGTPESIFSVIPNWRKGCRDLTLLFLGNALSRLDAHGRVCEPKAGWGSVTVDTDQWITKAIAEWEIPEGVCEHFDGFRSPNVELGFNKWPFIYRCEDAIVAKASAERPLEWWSNSRGFWAPEGTTNTVLSEGMLVRCGAADAPPFTTESTPIAFLDPAFGGDDCVLRFADWGPTEEAPEGCVVLKDRILIDPTPEPGEEKEYAIARRVQVLCQNKGIRPQHFGLDAWGTGRGVSAVLATEWSPLILKYEGVGRATDEPASEDDPRPGHEVYDRVTTQNWFRVRELVQGGQLKGILPREAVQFCSRTYTILSRRYSLQTKAECKELLKQSPDDADAVVGVCWVATQLGLVVKGSTAKPLPEQDAQDTGQVEDLGYMEPQVYEG